MQIPPKDPSQQQPGESIGILHVNQSILPAHNTRVKLRPVEFEDAEAEGFSFVTLDEEEDDDEYGEVPDRESIKKHTAQMLNARLKTKQTKKIKKKKAAKDGNESS